MGPRDEEIRDLHEDTDRMNQEVKYFKRVNKNLGLITEDLTMRQRGLAVESSSLTTTLEEQEAKTKQFKDDCFEVMQHIPNYKKLKKKVVELYKKYVLHEKIHDKEGKRDKSQKRQYLESMV